MRSFLASRCKACLANATYLHFNARPMSIHPAHPHSPSRENPATFADKCARSASRLRAGAEFTLAPVRMGSLKYPCSRLGSAPNLPFGAAASSVLDLHSFRADSNSKFRRPACRTDAVYTAGRRAVQFDRGKLRVRYLFIENGCNSVRSPYASTSSLSSGNQFENMRSAIAFMVFRAWMRVVLFCVRGFEIQRNSKGRIFILCHKSGISLRSSLFRSCPGYRRVCQLRR
jgi:hypothetical protein